MIDSQASPLPNIHHQPVRRPISAPKIAALVGIELVLFAVIGLAFWYQDLRYSLPTPVPSGWKPPAVGISLANLPPGRPTVFNFYNSDCPCSRFNLDHVRQLEKTYRSKTRFVLVMEGGTKAEEQSEFRKLDLNAEPEFDADGRLAKKLGVYATPQAVIVDACNRLVYRGNYNLGRYCADSTTQFARIAIDSVLTGRPLPPRLAQAGPAYGCAIPAVFAKDWH